MAIKIQINNLEALERLIGGDTETEIEIRNSIVQEFAKRHLKAVAQEQITMALKNTLIQEIKDKFLEEKKDAYNWNKTTMLNKETSLLIKNEVNNILESNLRQTIKDFIKSYDLDKRIERLILMHEEGFQDTCIKKFSDAEIERLVNQRIKEKLNIQ